MSNELHIKGYQTNTILYKGETHRFNGPSFLLNCVSLSSSMREYQSWMLKYDADWTINVKEYKYSGLSYEAKTNGKYIGK